MRRTRGLLLLLAATDATWASQACPVAERDLIGAWTSVGEPGFFEEFALTIDAGSRTFASWLHQRPEIVGATWAFENCHLVIVPPDGTLTPFRYKVLSAERGKLRLEDESDRFESVYRRIEAEP